MTSDNFNFFTSYDFTSYAGEWVAVSGNKIIARGETATEVVQKAENKTKERTSIMKVPNKDEVLIL